MTGLNLDLNLVVALWMGGAVLMVPFLGLTARFGLVPLLDAVTRMRAARSVHALDEDQVEERFARLESRLARVCETVAALVDDREPSLR
ncbi:MAG: hypothetical protein H0X65_15520 [Gemmatimonadetes bacterium]|nr:hypothetical protein [Gemmatimonadota bacterium]